MFNASLHRNTISRPCCSIKTSHLHVCFHHSAVQPVYLYLLFYCLTDFFPFKQTSSLDNICITAFIWLYSGRLHIWIKYPLCSLSCAAAHEAECFHTDSLLCFFHPITSCHTVTCAVLHGKCVSRALEISTHTHTHSLSLSLSLSLDKQNHGENVTVTEQVSIPPCQTFSMKTYLLCVCL